MTTTEQPTQPTEPCPSWCAIVHTWDGPEFHRSDVIATDLGHHAARANLFQAVGDRCEVRVVVAGAALTPLAAADFAHDLLALANLATGQRVAR